MPNTALNILNNSSLQKSSSGVYVCVIPEDVLSYIIKSVNNSPKLHPWLVLHNEFPRILFIFSSAHPANGKVGLT